MAFLSGCGSGPEYLGQNKGSACAQAANVEAALAVVDLVSRDSRYVLDRDSRTCYEVVPMKASTAQAYAGDLRDFDSWCELHDVGCFDRDTGDASNAFDQLVFAYLVHLLRDGRSHSTVRRRLTALRSTFSSGEDPDRVARLHAIEDVVLRMDRDVTAVLVASADPIIREGLAAVLARGGLGVWQESRVVAGPPVTTIWDYALVWLPLRHGIDTQASVRWITEVASAQVPIVALYPSRLTELARLRLAEAGVRYAIPHPWMADHLDDVPSMLTGATLPARFHLETPFAIRTRLGLRPSGELEPLLSAAKELPERVWLNDAAAHDLPRDTVRRLRRTAMQTAGVPPPLGRYSDAVRKAPTLPDWREVRRIVRLSFNRTT